MTQLGAPTSLPGGYKRDLLRRLKELEEQNPTANDMTLCEFFTRHYRDAAFKSAANIANELSLSKATVIRFASRIGFEKFADLQERLQQIVQYDLTAVDWSVSGKHDDLIARIMAREITNLQQLSHLLRRDELDAAVELLLSRPTVLVIGFRTAAPLVEHANYHMRKVLPQVVALKQADSTVTDLLTLYQGKASILAIGFSRYDRRFMEYVALARDLDYPILAVSEAHDSPLARLATLDLVAPSTFESYVGAYAAPIALLTVLISYLAQRLGPAASERLEQLEMAAEKDQTFY